MTRAEHYREAERLLRQVTEFATPQARRADGPLVVEQARVHAMLAAVLPEVVSAAALLPRGGEGHV